MRGSWKAALGELSLGDASAIDTSAERRSIGSNRPLEDNRSLCPFSFRAQRVHPTDQSKMPSSSIFSRFPLLSCIIVLTLVCCYPSRSVRNPDTFLHSSPLYLLSPLPPLSTVHPPSLPLRCSPPLPHLSSTTSQPSTIRLFRFQKRWRWKPKPDPRNHPCRFASWLQFYRQVTPIQSPDPFLVFSFPVFVHSSHISVLSWEKAKNAQSSPSIRRA